MQHGACRGRSRAERACRPRPAPPASPLRIALAYGVHLFTASGALAGLLALLEATRGDLRAAALWMLAAMAIDSVDGTLARAVGVAARAAAASTAGASTTWSTSSTTCSCRSVFLVAGGYLVHPALGRAAGARERLRLRPGRGQDGRRLLPRLPVLLERDRDLRLAARGLGVDLHGLRGALLGARLRAVQVRVSELPARAQAHRRRC